MKTRRLAGAWAWPLQCVFGTGTLGTIAGVSALAKHELHCELDIIDLWMPWLKGQDRCC